MVKFLDENGVKYLWTKLITKINNIGDIISKTPKIRIIGGGTLNKDFGCYPKYHVENGQTYIDQGYIPMLFTRRAVRQRYKQGSKLSGKVVDKTVRVNTTAEWRRYSDIFMEVTPPGMGVEPNQLAFYRNDDLKIKNPQISLGNQYDLHFGAIFHHKEYRSLYDGHCTKNLGALLIPELPYTDGFIAPKGYLYNGKGVSSTNPYFSSEPDLTNPGNSVYLRQLHFDFKFCFVKNKWVWRGESYDPKVSIIRRDFRVSYRKKDTPLIHSRCRAKYTLDDAVSNIVDIKVHVYPGVPIQVNPSGPVVYHTKYKVDILN